MLPVISLDREKLSSFDDSIRKEWLITNGLGGYASSTVLGINTRKYHGLLIAALDPPRDRRVFLTKLDEELLIGNNSFPLSSNEFQGVIAPRGFESLQGFSVSPFPTYEYTAENVEVKKRIFMPYPKNATVAVYDVSNHWKEPVRVRIFPLVSWRHFHSVIDRSRDGPKPSQETRDNCVVINFENPPSALAITSIGAQYSRSESWMEKIYLREEAERGESFLDDCFTPGYFDTVIDPKGIGRFALVAIADRNESEVVGTLRDMPSTLSELDILYGKELARRGMLLRDFDDPRSRIGNFDWLGWLVLAADSFVVSGRDPAEKDVIAGYHWFEAWGRDTFISLPGLLLVMGRFEDARRVFESFKRYCQHGLIPDFLPDQANQAAYNTVDATLWFIDSALQYLKYTGDFKFVREGLWETLQDVVENHVKGTLFNIRVDSDCLLSHGPQLTWMDAVSEGKIMTPREGKAVEIQALWFNALKIMALLAKRFDDSSYAEEYSKKADNAKASFEKFWNSEKSCLYDVLTAQGPDPSLRPNQTIAMALDFNVFDDSRGGKIMDVVERELLTPYGLRTLARSDPKYLGVYRGNRPSRDAAYHNGAVWPWLVGPFTRAHLRVRGNTKLTRDYAMKNFLLPLFSTHLQEAGLGSVSEVFDGDAPHIPGGCIAQAWSVAELLRTYVEEILQIRPKYEKELLRGQF